MFLIVRSSYQKLQEWWNNQKLCFGEKYKRLSLYVAFHTPRGAGSDAPCNFLSFTLTGLLELRFLWARKSMKMEEVEENYITTFKALSLVLFANTKNVWKLSFRNSTQDWIVLPFTGPKKVLRIILDFKIHHQ